MMIVLAIVIAYLIGSVPSGYLVIRQLRGEDLTRLGSGRTGATNAMRAGGLYAGLATAVLDIAKGALAIWVTRVLLSGPWLVRSPYPWAEVAAAVAVVVGHNWSIFMHGRGGAGTGPNVGAAIALWPLSIVVLPPIVPILLYVTGYASVASLTIAALVPLLFAFLARMGLVPWEYAAYGLATCIVVTWSLRPNIRRLLAGQERRVNLRGRRRVTPA